MANFKFGRTTGEARNVISTPLGATIAEKFTSPADLGKPVKLGAFDRYVLCAAGDKPEGFIEAIDGATVNNGFSFGSIQTGGRMEAFVTNAYAAGDLLTAVAAPLAAGTPEAGLNAGLPKLAKPGTAPTGTFLWRVISGAGTANSVAVIERIA